jgi:polyhydroxyalkanoate synthase
VRLIPSPKDFQHAAENVVDRVLHGRLADVTPLPAVVIDDGPQCHVTRFEGGPHKGEAVLFVPPLAAPAYVYDMRRGNSFAEDLVSRGRATYLVDYGPITFAERHLGFEYWVRIVLPRAINAVSRDAGGRPVHLISWSLGGVLASLAVADQPTLPVASLTMVGTPFDSHRVPLLAWLRPFVELTGGTFTTTMYRMMGTAPGPIVKRMFQIATFDKYVSKPYAIVRNLSDRDYLEQIEAVDRFMNGMIGYPGRAAGQLFHDVLRLNELADGRIELEGHEIDLRRIEVPVLAVSGEDDGIAPVAAVEHIAEFVVDVRLETAPGGHLGVLAGRNAHETTWPLIDDFIGDVVAAVRR